MDLIRDVLDTRVVDRQGQVMGRVDNVVLEIRAGAPPRVTALELGPAVLAYRIRPILGRWMAALLHGFGLGQGHPLRIRCGDILEIDRQITVDLALGDTTAAMVERRLRAWVRTIPGSS
jgi:hypothetical protein